MICRNCGAENQPDSVFCNRCGDALLPNADRKRQQELADKKNRWFIAVVPVLSVIIIMLAVLSMMLLNRTDADGISTSSISSAFAHEEKADASVAEKPGTASESTDHLYETGEVLSENTETADRQMPVDNGRDGSSGNDANETEAAVYNMQPSVFDRQEAEDPNFEIESSCVQILQGTDTFDRIEDIDGMD